MQNTAYTKHTYKHTTIGFLEDIKDMPNQYAYSKVFFDRWYRPENCTLIVAGDVKHDDLVALVTQYYGGWKRGGSSVVIPEEPPQTEPRSARVTWPLPTLPTLLLGYHVPAADPKNPDTPVLNILAQLVFGETSPLYEELVLKEQTAVQLSGEAATNRDPGLFQILVRVQARRSAQGPPANCQGPGRRRKDSDRSSETERDQVAPAVSIRRRARFGRRGCGCNRHSDLPLGPARCDQRAVRRLRTRHRGRSEACGRPVLSTDQRNCGHPGNGGQEMTYFLARCGRAQNVSGNSMTGLSEGPRGLPRGELPLPLPLGEGRGEGSRGCMRNRQIRAQRKSSCLTFMLGAVLPLAAIASADDRVVTPVAGAGGATLLHSPRDPLVALRIIVRAGSQDDPPGKEGLAALAASMVAEGGSKSPPTARFWQPSTRWRRSSADLALRKTASSPVSFIATTWRPTFRSPPR